MPLEKSSGLTNLYHVWLIILVEPFINCTPRHIGALRKVLHFKEGCQNHAVVILVTFKRKMTGNRVLTTIIRTSCSKQKSHIVAAKIRNQKGVSTGQLVSLVCLVCRPVLQESPLNNMQRAKIFKSHASILPSLFLPRYVHREGNRLVFFLPPQSFVLGFPLPLVVLLDTALPSLHALVGFLSPGPHTDLLSLRGSRRCWWQGACHRQWDDTLLSFCAPDAGHGWEHQIHGKGFEESFLTPSLCLSKQRQN